MKKIILPFLVAVTGLTVAAQNTSKDVFVKDEIVWYGLDFSKAKLIGQFSQVGGTDPMSGTDIKAEYIPGWNNLILNEPEKYNIKKAFRKTSVFKDLSPVEQSNGKIEPDNIFTYNDYKFENADKVIDGIVGSYSAGEKKEGIGLVFIIEYFDKPQEKASVYVTLFDISTKKVLFREHMYGKPGGFGMRNYWAKTIWDILSQIDKNVYKMWKKNYGG